MNKSIQGENAEILQYREATQELFAGIIPEGMLYELEQVSTELNLSLDVNNEGKSIYFQHRKQAWLKLAQLSNLRPPVPVIHIHAIYLKALILVIEAWRAVLNGNLFKATANFEVSVNKLRKAEELWTDIGLE